MNTTHVSALALLVCLLTAYIKGKFGFD